MVPYHNDSSMSLSVYHSLSNRLNYLKDPKEVKVHVMKVLGVITMKEKSGFRDCGAAYNHFDWSIGSLSYSYQFLHICWLKLGNVCLDLSNEWLPFVHLHFN